ncbi:MAG: hypothetical protein JSV90_04860 [Methanobacteriota archaeon]|nr:MAG: hypothetical protein JSV90_04860 [Euryarchaeota archaeon]
MTGRSLAVVLACLVLAVAAVGIGDNASAGGRDHNHLTHGEDEGYYDVNNHNSFDDDSFPGQSSHNRSGVAW